MQKMSYVGGVTDISFSCIIYNNLSPKVKAQSYDKAVVILRNASIKWGPRTKMNSGERKLNDLQAAANAIVSWIQI